MEIWINKNKVLEEKCEKYKNAYEFSIKRNEYSTMYTHIDYVWRQFGMKKLNAIYEDLFIIGISIFSIDKRVSRTLFSDNWTRVLDVSIPVLELDKWNSVKNKLNETLTFLTGDIWNLEFRKTEEIYMQCNSNVNKKNRLNRKDYNAVSLFSGGLDSFCGAIKLMQEGKSLCLVGHNEYPKLKTRQERLCSLINEEYPSQNCKFVGFSANSYAPTLRNTILENNENTSRGRSFLFLCIAITIAGILGDETTVYIPENGFIGLNIPLTNSRKGSCSTRTTHPYFIKSFNEILDNIGISNKIINIFAYKTKREIVNEVRDNDVFKQCVKDTISCSHPTLPRYNKDGDTNYPKNCGYCYPCLIRKSSLIDAKDINEEYTEKVIDRDFLERNEDKEIANDTRAVLGSIYRYNNIDEEELYRLIRCSGRLEKDEIEKFKNVYENTMNDLIELFSEDKEIVKYLNME